MYKDAEMIHKLAPPQYKHWVIILLVWSNSIPEVDSFIFFLININPMPLKLHTVQVTALLVGFCRVKNCQIADRLTCADYIQLM